MGYQTLVAGTTILASWANSEVRDQVVSVFATAAARTSAVSVPVEGMLSYRTDGHLHEYYDGAFWVGYRAIIPALKSVDEAVNTNAVSQADDALFWAMSANAKYVLFIDVVSNSNTTADIKFAFTGPASFTMTWQVIAADATSTIVSTGGFTQVTTVALGGIGGEARAQLSGVVATVGAGTLTLTWAQNTSNASNTIVRAGSYGYLTRIA